MKKTTNRLLSLVLCCALLGSTLPQTAFATGQLQDSGITIGTSGLCGHHKEHNAECGYTVGTPGMPCGHEHIEDECYTTVKSCGHNHEPECYPQASVSENEATPSNADRGEATACTHVCSEESGCITKELNCQHAHDESCGYLPAAEGTPCTYACKICKPQDSGQPEDKPQAGGDECGCENLCTAETVNADCPVCGADEADLTACNGGKAATPSDALKLTAEQVQELINALPSLEGLQAMTDEEQQAAYMEIQNAYKAYEALSDEEKAEIEGAEVFESLLGFFTALPPVTYAIGDKTGTPVPGTAQLANNVNTDKENTPIVYYGVYNGNPAAWYVIGYNDAGVVGTEGTAGNTPIATLLAAENMGNTTFGYDNQYGSSFLKTAVDNLKTDGIFSTGEQTAVKVRNLASTGYNDEAPLETSGIEGSPVTGAVLWPLSTFEAYNVGNTIRKLSPSEDHDYTPLYFWWLRSPGRNVTNAACVSGGGTVYNRGDYVNYDNITFGVRPAFNLDLNSVLFTSAAAGGKSATGMDSGLVQVQEDASNREWKLTVRDKAHQAFTVSNAQIIESGSKVQFDYQNAKTNGSKTNEYISAVVMDGGKPTWYGRILELKEASQAEGTGVQIDIPSGVTLDADTKLYVFNEQYNGDQKTDYASRLFSVADAETPTITGTLTGAAYAYNGQASALTVSAKVGDGGEFSYQWYRNSIDSYDGATEIPDANQSSYKPGTSKVGTTYYFCEVTNTNENAGGEKSAAKKTNIVKITVSASVAEFEYINAYKGTDLTTPITTFTYGDVIIVKAKPRATGVLPQNPQSLRSRTSASATTMRVYNGTTPVSQPVEADGNGVYTMEVDSKKLGAKEQDHTLTVQFSGDDTMAAASGTINIRVNPKEIAIGKVSPVNEVVLGESRYNNTQTTVSNLKATAYDGSTEIEYTFTAVFPQGMRVGDANEIEAEGFKITDEEQSQNYKLVSATSGSKVLAKIVSDDVGIIVTAEGSLSVTKQGDTYTVTMPYDADLAAVSPTVTAATAGASVQPGGTTENGTKYTVTAADLTTKDWYVKVTAEARPNITAVKLADGGKILSSGGEISLVIEGENFTSIEHAANEESRKMTVNYTVGGQDKSVSATPQRNEQGQIIHYTAKIELPRNTTKQDIQYTVTAVTGEITCNGIFTVPKKPSGHNDGGGSSGGGGSHDDSGDDSEVVSRPDAGKPNSPTTVQTPSVKPNTNGIAIINKSTVQNAVNAGKTDANKNGVSRNGVAVVVPIDNKADAGSLTIRMTAEALDVLVKEGVKRFEITTKGFPCFGFTLDTLKMLDTQSQSGDLTLGMKTAKVSSKEAQTAVGGRPVWNVSLAWVKNGAETPLTDWKGKTISVKLPYELEKDEQAGRVSAVYVKDDGSVEWLAKSSYHAGSRAVLLEAAHFSAYGVGYKTSLPAFSDIENHWAKEHILFAVSRGLFSGTGGAAFSPNVGMTRAMFVTTLGRLEGIDPAAYRTGKFTDVPADAWYAPYVNWAAGNGIVNGTGADTFSPDSPVTREQMAVIMANYAGQSGYTLPKTLEAVTFADSAQISAWAKDAVKAMQQAGVLTGKDGNRFDPKGTATRAEAAALLRRFVETVIDPQTANGWTQNDSGQYSYYRDGKAVTGWLRDEDKWYWLDKASGKMFSGGWKQIGGKWYYFYADGSMAVNTTVDGYKVGADGARTTE